MPARSPFRTARAALFAAVCVTLALTGHVMASGTPVAWWAPAGAGLVLAVVAWAAAGRERGIAAIGTGLLLAQAALHTLFMWAQRAPAGVSLTSDQIEAQWLRMLLCDDGTAPAHGTHRGSAAEILAAMGLDPALAANPPAFGPGHGASGPGHAAGLQPAAHAAMNHGSGNTMLLLHAAAALLTAVWLWRGERALHRAASLITLPLRGAVALFLAWSRPTVAPWPSPRRAPRAAEEPVAAPWFRTPVRRRGPPWGLAVLGT
ncbi:hypothetical protein GCM10023205_31980 [Yinghuangia aomiensis]|uniref:O-Antigen ligase n=1 Tax=Yinghuangia aomiensis TaxID=676205 RepID=A0ABP9H9Z6_9ACTN